MIILLFVLFLVNCGESKSSKSEVPSVSVEISSGFSSAGCSASSCHGTDGQTGANQLHDPDGNPVTNLTKSNRNLVSWSTWIREEAKPPMPQYDSAQYSDADLIFDYESLTGRSE